MSQTDYENGLRAANYTIALRGLKEVASALERAGEIALQKKCKQMGKEIITIAFKTLPRDLYRQISGKT